MQMKKKIMYLIWIKSKILVRIQIFVILKNWFCRFTSSFCTMVYEYISNLAPVSFTKTDLVDLHDFFTV